MTKAMKDPPAAGQRRVKAVDHAIDVMEFMAAAGRPLGITEIARGSGLSKATVHHILGTLVARRFAMREESPARYRLGWSLYELGSSVVRDVDISRIARPHLDNLAANASATSLLGILNEDAVLYLDRGEAPSGLQMVAGAGRRSPLHATASGKVLLAFSARSVFDRICSNPLRAFTRTTITDPVELRQQVESVRRNGYATCWQEREVGLASLAVPLRDYSGGIAGSLALAATSARLNRESIEQFLVPLQRTGAQIESELGGGAGDGWSEHGAAVEPAPGLTPQAGLEGTETL